MPSYLDEMIKKSKEKKARDSPDSISSDKVKDELRKSLEALKAKSNIESFREVRPVVKSEAHALKAAIIPDKEKIDEDEKKSEFQKELESSEKILITSYGQVKIYKIKGKSLLHYEVPVPQARTMERTIINTIREAATRIISVAPYKIRDPEQRKNVYYQQIMEILRSSPELHIPEQKFDFYASAVVREMVGYGIIDPLTQDDNLEEIMVIGPKKPVYVFHRDYEMMTTGIEFYSEQEIEDLINKIARQVGRRIDQSNSLLDARLPDGSRVNATIPPSSVDGPSLTIRKFRKNPYSIIDLIKFNTVGSNIGAYLWVMAEGLGVMPANVLISGGTGSGKTTLLNVMASFIPKKERIISIEDTAELNLPLEHFIRMEARPPGMEGTGEITMDILTKNSLRMRPDRIIVGEVRHNEAYSLFTAMNTGHNGCFGTIHANSPQETIVRITSPPMNVPELMLAGLDIIIVMHRIHDKQKGTIRRITAVAELSGVLEKKAQTQTIFEWDPVKDELVETGIPSIFMRKLEKFTGLSRMEIEREVNKRKKFLEELARESITNNKVISDRINDYYIENK
ncbi:MAG: ATPase, T2SS/T4P/T4SS family [archaeon]